MTKIGLRRWPEFSLPLVLFVCFGICLGIVLFSLPYLRETLVHERGADLARTAAVVADTLDRILFERLGDVTILAASSAVQAGASEEITTKLHLYRGIYGYYSWLAVADQDGRIVSQTDQAGPVDTSSADAKSGWFEDVRRTGSISLLDAHVSREAGAVMAVGFSAPIYGPRGEFRGAVTARMPLDKLRALIDREGALRYQEGERYDWLLLDRAGTVISEASKEEVGYRGLDLTSVRAADTDPSKPGFLEELHQRRGVPVLTGYAKTRGYGNFPGFNWTVLVRIDRDHAYAPINRFVWTVGLISLLLVAPLAGFGIWASWQLIRERRSLRQTQKELRSSVAELTRSNKDLQQFAYVASHDLQEPLRMVASYTQLLQKRFKGKLDADADDFIGYAVEGAKRMQRLITDLLTYSRVTTQGNAFQPVDCHAVFGQAVNDLRLAIEEAGAAVTYDRLPVVMGDAAQLGQLFQNLVFNAIKFRRDEEPPRVHAAAALRQGEWLFSIRDNGIGIDPQYADRIFVIFQRLHNPDEYPGTGIGLALCKKIVEHHGGRIWVESQLGQGATFCFTLPRAATG